MTLRTVCCDFSQIKIIWILVVLIEGHQRNIWHGNENKSLRGVKGLVKQK